MRDTPSSYLPHDVSCREDSLARLVAGKIYSGPDATERIPMTSK
jgi:proteasome assembly chaperone (PAC2) family protein